MMGHGKVWWDKLWIVSQLDILRSGQDFTPSFG